MKRILLVTILDNYNIGTFLQAFASVKLLQKSGNVVTLLRYVRSNETCFLNAWYKYDKKKLLLRLPLCIIQCMYNYFFRSRFISFLYRYNIPMTKRVVGIEGAKRFGSLYDTYVVGSDQVWNFSHNKGLDETFFLDFVTNTDVLKYSLSSSMGTYDIGDNKNYIRDKLSSFNKISVREKTARDYLLSIGLNKVEWLIDPTLVINKTEWLDYMDSINFSYPTEPFLLVYSVEPQQKLIEYYAKQLASKLNLKIARVSATLSLKRSSIYDFTYDCASPEQFISLFDKANFIIASSFHGTAFSINFHKQFVTITPNKFSSRIDSLLSLFKLEDRKIVDYQTSIETLLNTIDYNKIDSILKSERKKTNLYISQI